MSKGKHAKGNVEVVSDMNDSTTKGSKKKLIIPIICIAAVILIAAVVCVFSFDLFGFNSTGTASEDEAPLTVVTDEDAYIFSQGIYIGSTNASGKSYRQMRQACEKEVETLVKEFSVEVSAADKKFTYKKADFTFDNNIDLVLQQAATYNDSLIGAPVTTGQSKTFDLTFEVNKASVEAKVAELAKEVDVEPQNASIGETDGSVGVVEAKLGKKVDQPALVKALVTEINALAKGQKVKASPIKAVIKEAHPDLGIDDLDGKITLLASYTSVSTNGANGNHNMALSLNACNGSVIGPGETWSFNACTGNSNLTSLGYLPATVISGGKFVQGIGGGICQASTTIYNAAIRTNMVIVERYNHYFKSSYADAGLDATIDYPNLDLKLKNPTEYPMYLQCFMSGNTLYCNIYGYQDPSFDEVRISSYTYNESYAANSFSAGATRTFLKNGKVVKEEALPSSSYAYYSPSSGDDTTGAASSVPGSSGAAEDTKPVQPTDAPAPDTTPDPVVTDPPVVEDPVEPVPPVVEVVP